MNYYPEKEVMWPDDYCDLPFEKLKEIVERIASRKLSQPQAALLFVDDMPPREITNLFDRHFVATHVTDRLDKVEAIIEDRIEVGLIVDFANIFRDENKEFLWLHQAYNPHLVVLRVWRIFEHGPRDNPSCGIEIWERIPISKVASYKSSMWSRLIYRLKRLMIFMKLHR